MALYGPFPMNIIQLGKETVHGTGVAATARWRGAAADIEDDLTIQTPGDSEASGMLVPTERTYISQKSGVLTIPDTELTFEQFPYVLEAGMRTVSPSGAGPYTYTYDQPITTRSGIDIATYTLESGNLAVGDEYEMAHSFVESWQISGQSGEPWMLTSTWRGEEKASSTLTSGLSLPSVNEALFNRSKLYIDAYNGTVGTTQKEGVWIEASLQVTTGIVPVFTGDGAITFHTYKFVKPSGQFTITMELNDDNAVATERAAYRSQATRLFRFEIDGPDANHEIVTSFAGRYDSFSSWQNSDDNTTVQASGTVRHSSDASLFLQVLVTNQLSTLP